MKRILLAVLILGAVPSLAQASFVAVGSIGPYLQWTSTDIGGGLCRYDVYLDDPANAKSSYFLGALSFSGLIKQDLAFGILAVNDQVTAASFDGAPSGFTYAKATDSFFFTPFTANLAGPGITDSVPSPPDETLAARTYAITAGSGGGSLLDYVQIAQIISSGISVSVTGTVSRAGGTFPTVGTMWCPEPSTLVLLGMGAVGLAFFAKRRLPR